jgi:chemotaxis protein histidine kinase CheA
MSVPSGRLQFFTLEASDYLERLGLIIGRPTPPDPEELVRLSRALRGAALMAGLPAFAQASQSFEHIAKSLRDRQTDWTPERAELLASAVDELRRLVRQAGDWSDQDTAAAEALGRELGGGRIREPIARTSTSGEEELKPSVRAFVAREGASIAGTLEHAAQAVELGQAGDTAEVVLQRLQPLRGLASLPSLSPLPEFLDAIELTVRAVRDGAAPPDAAPALRQVAQAVTRLAREIADRGTTAADAPEILGGARVLLTSFGRDDDVVEITSLFAAGDTTPIVARGRAPEPQAPPDPRIELVSLADRFRQAADQLEMAPGAAARTLSIYALAAQLGALTRAGRRERRELTAILAAIRGAIHDGAAEREAASFAAHLRTTATRLTQSSEGRDTVVLAEDFDDLISNFEGLLRRDDERDVVPIADLLAAEPASEPVADAPPGAEPVRTSFEQTFSTYHQLLERDRAPDPAALAALAALAAPAALAESDVVAIDHLLYRGRRALERADVVRRDLTTALKSNRTFQEIEPLVSELIDLVPLALAE